MAIRVSRFVRDLGELRVDNAWNPWGEYDPELDADFALANRSMYLDDFLSEHVGAEYALIGLAPGYAGARFSGVPFKDEEELYSRYGVRLSQRFSPWAEGTAGTVRATTRALGIDPVYWNVFPIHPHNPGDNLSNRTPTRAEIEEYGIPWLTRFLQLVHPGIVVPVGRAAETALKALAASGMPVNLSPYVRHPSHGGEEAFRRGMLTIVRGS